MKTRFGNGTIKRLEEELIVAQRLNNLRLYKRVKALRLVAEEVPMKDIAKLMNVSTKTVHNWLSRFIVSRFSWLVGQHYRGRGRKPRLSKKQKKKLYDIIVEGPERYGFDCGLWNCAMIVEVVLREFNVFYNPRYLCTLLKKMGLSYQKVGFESDHLDEEKREEWVKVRWPKILQEAKERNAVILFCDEVSFAQWGSLGRTWGPKGKQFKIKTTGKRKALKMFGAIEFVSGSFHYMESEDKFNGQSYILFLQQLLMKYSCPIILIEDGAPYHRGRIVNEFKAATEAKGRLFVHRLPSYSPDYNPIEKLWKNTKRDATHCKYFPSFEDLRSAVVKAFKKYMQDATKVICVMKKLRNEAGVA